MKRTLSVILSLSCFLALPCAFGAGDLDPPPGPVTPTMKSLEEIEPRIELNSVNTPGDSNSVYTITAPGSYYLSDNVFGASGKNGIEIASDGVTIDLMGFSLIGVPGSLDGIFVAAGGQHDIAIHNGSATRWGGSGLELTSAFSARIANVRTYNNAGAGIKSGANSVVTGCTAENNGSSGITGGAGSVISGCSAMGNTTGISGSTGSNISGCTASGNTNGFSLGRDSMISSCTAQGNDGVGIIVSRECYALNNTCMGNASGIKDNFGQNRIEGNHCAQNDTGFEITNDYNFIVRNTAAFNTRNWDVAAGNVLLVVEAQRDLVGFVGNAGGTTPGSTDPNANYSIFIP